MQNFSLAAAQTIPVKGNVQENIRSHVRLIKQAAEKQVELIVFPELSLTGYEPELAAKLAFTRHDERLAPIRMLAVEHQMIIICGAPIKLESGLHIGAFIAFPDNSLLAYTKHHLHTGEEQFFEPGTLNPHFALGKELCSIAICADIAHPSHPQKAANAASTLYLSSVFITPGGYEADSQILRGYAKQHNMLVLMANFGGPSGVYEAAGRSAIWSDTGKLLDALPGGGEGLLIARKKNKVVLAGKH